MSRPPKNVKTPKKCQDPKKCQANHKFHQYANSYKAINFTIMLLCNSYDLTKTCAISAGGRTVIIVLLQPDAFAVAVCFCSYRRCYTHAKAFSLVIIVLFPNQNTIAKVAEKGKRVAVTCSSRPGDKPCFFLTDWFFIVFGGVF